MIFFAFVLQLAFGVSDSKVIGHNLTPTVNTLPKGGGTVGNFAAGLGITDDVTIAASTWLIVSYNMYNLSLRQRVGRSYGWDMGYQLAYFKTGEFYPNLYQMEATSLWLLGKRVINGHYTLHLSGNYMFFFDETVPFSLRREPFNNQPYQLSLTSLHEVNLTSSWSMAGEVGTLGLNYTYPHFFVGISANYQTRFWLFQFGVSHNMHASGELVKSGYQQTQNIGGAIIDRSFHPELQIQYFW